MSDSEEPWGTEPEFAGLSPDSPYALDLPVAPDWFSEAPPGTPDDGWRLMLEAVASLKDPDAVFRRREQHRVIAEFQL
ncbi:MAG: hypothetical protein KDM81_16545 [Verrucomicrobiae bacterium]|nr:hypothetical protein [Verrucomicrobiae bacterium]